MKLYLFILLSAISLSGCLEKSIFEPEMDPDLIVQGDTLKVRYDERKWQLANDFFVIGDTSVPVVISTLIREPARVKDIEILSKGISNSSGRPFRMIAVGGGPVAGVRNGGYTNFNLLTSFTNLVANQIGIEYNLPVFEDENANGFGALIPTAQNPTGGRVQKYKVVNNNLAVKGLQSDGTPILSPIEAGERIDLFGVRRFPGFARSSENVLKEPFLIRILESGKRSYPNLTDKVLGEEFDLILEASNLSQYTFNGFSYGQDRTFENGLEGYVDERTGCTGPGCVPKFSDRLNFLAELQKRKGLKGVLYTAVPIHLQPFTQVFKVQEVQNKLAMYQKPYLLAGNPMYIFPYPAVDSLMSDKVNMNNKPFINGPNNKVIPSYPVTELESGLEGARKETFSLSKQLDWAVVDITTIYKSIISGTYFSPDGHRISGGDFFAEDGYSPSAIGHVVLANETIKALNMHYGTTIPYVKMKLSAK